MRSFWKYTVVKTLISDAAVLGGGTFAMNLLKYYIRQSNLNGTNFVNPFAKNKLNNFRINSYFDNPGLTFAELIV